MFTKAYFCTLLSALYGEKSTNARTGVGVRTAIKPLHLDIDLSNGNLPLAGNRTIYPKVAGAEVAWQLMGTKDPSFIMKHAPKVWGKFIDDDGEIENAYGYRWNYHFGRNQIKDALEILRKDRTSRQAHVSTWDPLCDNSSLDGYPSKNIPCITDFSISIVGEKLNMAVHMRSSDIYVGLPYDVLAYALLVDAFAVSLECKPGFLSFQLSNAHIYAPHVPGASVECEKYTASSLNWKMNVQKVKLPGWSIEDIVKNPEGYVDYFKSIKMVNFNGTLPDVVA